MMEYHIPLILNGEIIKGGDLQIRYNRNGKMGIFLPSIDKTHIKKLRNLSWQRLYEKDVDDIISFLSEVGELWKNRNYDLRRESCKIASLTTGYHEKMIEHSYDMIPNILNKDFLYRTLDIEIQNRYFLDKWIKVGNTIVRATPLGKLLHIVAGNVPVVSILSFVMGILTKNVNIVKVASGDPATFIYFALSFRDIDKNYPITKTTSALYWEHDSEAEKECFELANGILVWGGVDAIHSARKKSRPGQVILEFGPRKSIQLVDKEVYKDENRLKKIAESIAHDLSLYDQQACHSPQIAFAERPAEKLCSFIAEALIREGKKLPKGYASFDEKALITHQRMLARFRGDKVFQPKDTEWTIILTKRVEDIVSHPLSRTLFVVEVNDIRESIKYIDSSVMVVAFSSDGKLRELKDELILRGVDKLTLIGRMGYFQLGYPQEGRRNLCQLVRWVGIDSIEM